LPPDEETCIVEVDVLGRSCLQTAARLNLSVDGLYKLRRRAYAHLADDIRG
jgi:DNA-directed RNA polymerase specialized sigma24 family protein